MTDQGYVYFIQGATSGHIKIGFSSNPAERCRTLNTASAETLTLILKIPGTWDDEQALHAKFHEDRIKGEWFRSSDALHDFIGIARKVLTPAAAAGLLQITVKTLYRWRKAGRLPYLRLTDGTIRYRAIDVEALIAASVRLDVLPEREPTSIAATRYRDGEISVLSGVAFRQPATRTGGR